MDGTVAEDAEAAGTPVPAPPDDAEGEAGPTGDAVLGEGAAPDGEEAGRGGGGVRDV